MSRIGFAGVVVTFAALLQNMGCGTRERDQPLDGDLPMPPEVVLLIHGMGRTSWSMSPLKRPLEDAGFEVRTWSYESFDTSIGQVGEALRAEIARVAEDPRVERLHLVGHSLGAVAIRWALSGETLHPSIRLGRVVMLAPPNGGSPMARSLEPILGWWIRPLAELSDEDGSEVRNMSTPSEIEIGVIAARWDEKVPVESTHLEGEADHLVVNGLHGTLMLQSGVQRQVVSFLQTGRFERD